MADGTEDWITHTGLLHTTMARKSAKKIDVSTAEQAHGQLRPEGRARDVYELLGIKTSRFTDKTYAGYKGRLDAMDLVELHEEAEQIGTMAFHSREATITELLKRFLRDNPEEKRKLDAIADQEAESEANLSIRERAERILARGR